MLSSCRRHGNMFRLHLVLVVLALLLHRCRGSCRFPDAWAGTWFQSGVLNPIRIEATLFSFKGFCVQSDGDKFLLEDRRDSCFRCIVVHEKHPNVLQYKETYCDPKDSLESMCSGINGDAQLYTMFRVNATPEPCPFAGPFTFTYNRGHGECRYPLSGVDSCTEDWRLLFRYQACPDVPGTESVEEELNCLATWKEGSTKYLVGRLEYAMAKTSEDKYRCFIYEESDDETGYQVAQSGDATCIGLFTPSEGSRTMRLTRAFPPLSSCEFPRWVTSTPAWHTLDRRKLYLFDLATNATFNVTSSPTGEDDGSGHATPEMQVTCVETRSVSERRLVAVLYVTIGCRNGYMCATFYQRKEHVIELQHGHLEAHPDDACSKQIHNDEDEFVTLLSRFHSPSLCPRMGKYNVIESERFISRKDTTKRDLCRGFAEIHMGCGRTDLIEFQPNCPKQGETIAYQCHGNWQENGTHYLIATLRGTNSRFCFIYSESDNMMKLSSVKESCDRRVQPGIHGVMAFNVTSQGDCTDANAAWRPSAGILLLAKMALLFSVAIVT